MMFPNPNESTGFQFHTGHNDKPIHGAISPFHGQNQNQGQCFDIRGPHIKVSNPRSKWGLFDFL
jgi:hypothetical protein